MFGLLKATLMLNVYITSLTPSPFSQACHQLTKRQVIRLNDFVWEALPFLSRLPLFVMRHINSNEKINFAFSMAVTFAFKRKQCNYNVVCILRDHWENRFWIARSYKRYGTFTSTDSTLEILVSKYCDWQPCLLVQRDNNNKKNNWHYQGKDRSLDESYSVVKKKHINSSTK